MVSDRNFFSDPGKFEGNYLMAPTASQQNRDEYYRQEKAKKLAAIYGEGVLEMYKTEVERADALERQAARLLEHAAHMREQAERFGPDDYPNGAVIVFDKVFTPGGRVYNYAAIKTIHANTSDYTGRVGHFELWYTTGPKSPKGYTWDELIKWMGDGVEEIFYVTEMTTMRTV